MAERPRPNQRPAQTKPEPEALEAVMMAARSFHKVRVRQRPRNEESDEYTHAMVSRLLDGEEPEDVLYADVNGARLLDPDYGPAAAWITANALAEGGAPHQFLHAIDTQRKLWAHTLVTTAEAGTVTAPGPQHLLPFKVLAGEYGEDIQVSFAQGAIAAMEYIVNEVLHGLQSASDSR